MRRVLTLPVAPLKSAVMAAALYRRLPEAKERREKAVLKESLRKNAEIILSHAREIERIAELERPEKRDDSPMLRQLTGLLMEKAEQVRNLAEDIDSRFSLFIVGMGKFGKSTLLNALAAAPLAEVDVLPKTWKIDVFEAAPPGTPVKIRFRDGSRRECSYEETKAFLASEEQRRQESEDFIYRKFREMSRGLRDPEAMEELQVFLKAKHLYVSPVSEVYWPCEETGLLSTFRLVDTPGLWQDYLPDDMRSSLRDYYHKADGVIWILDAQKISAQKPRELLDDLEKALKQVGRRTDNVVAVLNRIDTVAHGDPEIVSRLVGEAYRLFGDLFPEIVPLSALHAFEAAKSGNEQLGIESGLNRLKDIIEKRFRRHASKIKHQSKVYGVRQVFLDIQAAAGDYHARLEADEKTRLQLASDFQATMSRYRQEFARNMGALLGSYEAGVTASIEVNCEDLIDAGSHNERVMILETIFSPGALNAAVKEYLTGVKETFIRVGNHWLKQSVFSEYKHLSGMNIPELDIKPADLVPEISAADFDISMESLGIGALISLVGMAALGPVGFIGGILASLFGVSRSVARFLRLPGIRSTLKSRLDKITTRVSNLLNEKVNELMGLTMRQVSEVRDSSFEALHVSPGKVKPLLEYLENIKSQSPVGLEPIPISRIIFRSCEAGYRNSCVKEISSTNGVGADQCQEASS